VIPPGGTIVRRKSSRGQVRCVLIISVQPGYDSFSNVLTKDGVSFIENSAVNYIRTGLPAAGEVRWGELK
jgi:hypothetical protein